MSHIGFLFLPSTHVLSFNIKGVLTLSACNIYDVLEIYTTVVYLSFD